MERIIGSANVTLILSSDTHSMQEEEKERTLHIYDVFITCNIFMA